MRDLTGNVGPLPSSSSDIRLSSRTQSALRIHLPMVFTSLHDALTFAGIEWEALADAIDIRIVAASYARAKPRSDVKTVDIVKDVTTPVVVGWLAAVFGLLQTGLHSQLELSSSLSNL